ncbi:MAG TPA: hypothetical protein VHM26_01245 [Chitinophagaceae bacterium]|jgi:hypothetical protein|nr:hypothetical protein [Chitinophagaceae bacterium]
MRTIDHLYRSYNPEKEYAFVFDRRYTKDVAVALRPFSIKKDLFTFNKWINEVFHTGYKKINIPPYFDGSYFDITLPAPNTQSLWGLINEQSSFQVDLYKATEHQLPFREKGLMLSAGDVFMHVIISPRIIGSSSAAWILPACIDHCFRHKGVERIMLMNDAHDIHYRELAEKASPSSHCPLKNGRSVYFYELISSA